jgi:hypothetical protein
MNHREIPVVKLLGILVIPLYHIRRAERDLRVVLDVPVHRTRSDFLTGELKLRASKPQTVD